MGRGLENGERTSADTIPRDETCENQSIFKNGFLLTIIYFSEAEKSAKTGDLNHAQQY